MIQFRFHKNIVFLLVFCLPIFAFSQSRFEQRKFEFYHQIDSLKLHPEKLSLHYIRGGYPKDSLLIYYQEVSRAYQDIQQELNKAQQIYFLYEIGQLEILTGKYDEAEETFEIARTLFDKDHENYWNPDVYISYYLADALRATGKTRKSNDIFLSILDIPLVQKDSAIQMEVKGCISENFEAMGDFDDAMELCIQ
ncbi:MAG: hypothetical protein GQ527_08025, partial [Bacteroidales bacterium]|nr:hypothetical protein [Bacteroidales bacterium]